MRGDCWGLMQLYPSGLQHTSALSQEDAFTHQLPAVIAWGLLLRAFAPWHFGQPCMGWALSYDWELQVLKGIRPHGSAVRNKWGLLCSRSNSQALCGSGQHSGAAVYLPWYSVPAVGGQTCANFPGLWTFLFFFINTSWKPRQIRILWTSLSKKILLVAKSNSGLHGGSCCSV